MIHHFIEKVAAVSLAVFILLSFLSPVDALAVNNWQSAINHSGTDKNVAFAYYDLGSLGGRYAVANDINNSNVIVGSSQNTKGMLKAFIKTPDLGKITELLTMLPENCLSKAERINNRNQIIGTYNCSGQEVPYLFDYQSKKLSLLTIPAEITGNYFPVLTDINNTGQITGQIFSNGILTPVFWYAPDKPLNLTQFFAALATKNYGGTVQALNDRCEIVGYIRVGADTSRAFKMSCSQGFKITELGPLSGDIESAAAAINERGVIAGASGSGQTWQQPVIWEKKGISKLPSFDVKWTNSEAINNKNQVVGVFSLNEFTAYGYFSENGRIYDLNNVTEFRSAIATIEQAVKINDRGAIIGNATYGSDPNYRAFVLFRK